MVSILVHLTHGLEHPTRAALAFHVTKASLDAGNKTTMFFAGDAVQLLREGVLDNLNGLGTGNLRNCYDTVAASGETLYYSGMSAKSRGLNETDLKSKNVKPGSPADLVTLSLEHDRMFTLLSKGINMANVVNCKDLGFDCSFVAKADSEDELLGKVAQHAASAHGITEVTPELVEQVKSVIRYK